MAQTEQRLSQNRQIESTLGETKLCFYYVSFPLNKTSDYVLMISMTYKYFEVF